MLEAAQGATSIDRAVVATDSQEVVDAVASAGGDAVLTGEHPNGTSRLAEAARLLGLGDEEIIVNVQGDEPEIDPGVIDAAVTTLRSSGAEMATVASPFAEGEDTADPNIVKVVCRADGRALYFSRSRIPYERSPAPALKHVGLYVYRRRFLEVYASLAPTPLEQAERLEQLRVLEHGYDIAVAIRPTHHHGIDTPEQYEAFVTRWRQG